MPFLTNFFPGQEAMTVVSMMNLLFVIGIPLIAIILGIVRVVFRRRIGKGWAVGLGLFWLMNTVSLVGFGGTLAQEFLVEDHVEELVDASAFAADTVQLSLNKMAHSEGPRFRFGPDPIGLPGADVFTQIRKSTDADWHLMLSKFSRARNGKDARSLATELNVSLEKAPGKLVIPSHVPFTELSKWRAQEIVTELKVPVGAYVYLGPALIHNGSDIPYDHFPRKDKQLYQMSANGELICQDCPAKSYEEGNEGEGEGIGEADSEGIGEADGEGIGETDIENKTSEYQDFNSLDITGPFKVTIEQGDTYDVQFSGNGRFQEVLTTVQNDQTLSLSLGEATDAPVRVYITVPSLKALNLIDTDDVLVKDFSLEQLDVTASGEFELKTDVNVELFTLEAQNGVEVELVGSTGKLIANLSNESRLDTDRGTVELASLTAAEGSRIKIGEGVEVQEQNISENSNLKIVN